MHSPGPWTDACACARYAWLAWEAERGQVSPVVLGTVPRLAGRGGSIQRGFAGFVLHFCVLWFQVGLQFVMLELCSVCVLLRQGNPSFLMDYLRIKSLTEIPHCLRCLRSGCGYDIPAS